jgi:hypothetical protein
VLVALRKQVQAGQRVTVLARVEDQARPFRVRPAKESSAASLDPLTLIVPSRHAPNRGSGVRIRRRSGSVPRLPATRGIHKPATPSSGTLIVSRRPTPPAVGYFALHEANVLFLSAALSSFRPPRVSPSTMSWGKVVSSHVNKLGLQLRGSFTQHDRRPRRARAG